MIFSAVYSERSVTKAAARLGMTQPGVSNALTRLQQQLGKALFVRSGQGIEPTAEADRLAPLLRDGLMWIDQAIASHDVFEPENDARKFTIALPNSLESIIVSRLVKYCSLNAPNVSIQIRPLAFSVSDAEAANGSVDLWINSEPKDDAYWRSTFLIEEDAVLIVRDSDPRFIDNNIITIEQLSSAKIVIQEAKSRISSRLQIELESKGHPCNVICTTESIWSVPQIVSEGDFVGIVSRKFAESVSKAAGLKIFDLPIHLPAWTWYMIWPAEHDKDPALTWLRNNIRDLIEIDPSKTGTPASTR